MCIIAATVLILCVLFAGCTKAPEGVEADAVFVTEDGSVSYRVETVVSNLEVPWAITFTPDRLMLVTERPGRIRVVENGKLRSSPLAVIEDTEHTGESGLMDLILHPRYSENRMIYLSYVYDAGGSLRLRVARYRASGSGLERDRVIIENIPAARFHSGCRLGFGTDGKLYVTTGDAGDGKLSQQLDSLAGKTLRLEEDGSIPQDNPFVSRPGARGEIWSYGHRNAQGIDWHPETGLQFQSEHGPSGMDGPGGGDEINLIEKAHNYGWPVIHHRQTGKDMVTPLLEYTPAVAPASGRFYARSTFPGFKGNYFVGCLRGESIIRIRTEGRRVSGQEFILRNKLGRIRAVTMGPDGFIYFSTSNRDGRGSPAPNDDRIMRIVPGTR